MDIKENVEKVLIEIKNIKEKYHMNQKSKICAATKYVGVNEINKLVENNITDIGENRVDAFLEKYEQLKNQNITWHFIGNLQSRKVKEMINKIHYLHSLNRDSLAKEINKYRTTSLNCFVEVNCSNEASKQGLSPQEVKNFIYSLEKYDKIKVIGLMTMAKNTNDANEIHRTFQLLKQIQQEIIKLNLTYAPCQELSMGMSNDYLIAVEEGATIVRIGSRLFS